MEGILILTGFIGFVMAVVGFAMIASELAIDSFSELLLSLFSRTNHHFFELANQHIRQGWPHTKFTAFLFYGGISIFSLSVAGFWLIPAFLEFIQTRNGR